MNILTHCREANSNRCCLADMLKHLGLAVASDVMSHLKVAKSPCREIILGNLHHLQIFLFNRLHLLGAATYRHNPTGPKIVRSDLTICWQND